LNQKHPSGTAPLGCFDLNVAILVHSARGSDVTHVIVEGQLRYRDGELLTLDEDRIMAEADRRARQWWARI
jgi:cytosine/adenosine deaminase-related metal-dependent hydrolase